jgi:hypothetical protein
LIVSKHESASETNFLVIETELIKLIKVEDWFKDGGSSKKRVIKKGKGPSPNIDSTVKGKR